MGSIGFSFKLSACILVFLILENFGVNCNSHWCYDDPKCGPNTWGYFGMKQSPIDIDTGSTKSKHNFETIHYKHYEDPKIVKKIKNSGFHLVIDFYPKATISGPGFQAVYYLWQAHFHWGSKSSNGAEHTINGKRAAMEMHLVHTKNNMTIDEASKLSDGVVVIAFTIEIDHRDYNQITTWDILAKYVKKVTEKDNFYDLNGEFSVGGLLNRADLSHYYRYQGSFTSPPAAEAVIWIVYQYPIYISYRVANILLTSLYFTTASENRRMQNNFRPTQPLNGREVFYYTEYQSIFSCMTNCFYRWY